jgi:hypothetical protein
MKRHLTSFIVFILALTSNAQYIAEVLPTPSGRGRAMAAGGGQIIGVAFGTGGGPALWDGPGHNLIDLASPGYSGVVLQGVGGGTQVGYGVSDTARALMWTGSPGTVIDLHPVGYTGSLAYATSGMHQVGAAGVGGNLNHAVLWSGTSSSYVDLHPVGHTVSEAVGVHGNVQVGSIAGGAISGAVLWRGSAASMQFLPAPIGVQTGGAAAVHDNQVVGNSSRGAVLWDIDKWTYTDLGEAVAMDTNGIHQVGIRGGLGEERAIRWTGTEASALDLHQFVPSNIAESRAMGIDENGVIAGWGTIVGVGSVPIVWTPVPEPATAIAICAGIGLLLLRGRLRKPV